MKKLFTLCTAMVLTLMASAQVDETFQFVDASGNVVADGSTIVINQLDKDGKMFVPLSVKNNSGEKAAACMYEDIDKMPNGEWQTCAFGSCMKLTATGYSASTVAGADYNAEILTEWMPVVGSYATWEATLQILVFDIVETMRFGQVFETVGTDIIGYGPKVTVRFEYTNTEQAGQDKQTWWGYVGTEDRISLMLGNEKAVTYDCAAFYEGSNAVANGKQITAVRFSLSAKNVANVKVWIAENRPTNIDTDALQVVNVNNLVEGINEVTLPTPYTIGSKGVYVGYSFTITKVEYESDAYPVNCAGYDQKNALWYRTTGSAWADRYGNGYGCLYQQVKLQGQFYENAAAITNNDLGEYTSSIGGSATVYVPITNYGTETINSIDYTVTTNGKASGRGHIDLGNPIAFGSTKTYTIEVAADETPGMTTKTVTISKVNGKSNENKANMSSNFTMLTVYKLVDRGIAVEEFTGTQCGYCPRGMAGMDKLRKKYGDKFVGTAVHGYAYSKSEDAMYLDNWKYNYAYIFSGSAPSCQLNRSYGEIDPYYGTRNDICDDFENELRIPAKVGIKLTGKWNDDFTKIQATAELEPVVNGQSYTIEYALIADELTGTTSAWNQVNYYATSSSKDPDIAQFCSGGQYGTNPIKGWKYNDVVIATCYSNGRNLTVAPGELTMGKNVKNTFTLTMPTDQELLKAIDRDKVAVVAFVISANGAIANAAKFYMGTKALQEDVNGDGVIDVADISSVISVMAGTSTFDADVNGDGVVDVADISAIISKMASTSREM